MGILSICHKMVNCNYETYWENLSLTCEKTNAFYECARVLNRSLDKNTAPKPTAKRDGDGGVSGSDTGDTEDPFIAEIPNIMTDVEDSVTKYADEMAKKVLEYTGGEDISSYLGHIFSTGLNFPTSMWQLVTLEAVYLPMIMREHLCLEISTLQLFVECLPMLAPCAIPPKRMKYSSLMHMTTVLSYTWMPREGRRPPPHCPAGFHCSPWTLNFWLSTLTGSGMSLISFGTTTNRRLCVDARPSSASAPGY